YSIANLKEDKYNTTYDVYTNLELSVDDVSKEYAKFVDTAGNWGTDFDLRILAEIYNVKITSRGETNVNEICIYDPQDYGKEALGEIFVRNFANLHWVLSLENTEESVDNDGGGDCAYYAFYQGLRFNDIDDINRQNQQDIETSAMNNTLKGHLINLKNLFNKPNKHHRANIINNLTTDINIFIMKDDQQQKQEKQQLDESEEQTFINVEVERVISTSDEEYLDLYIKMDNEKRSEIFKSERNIKKEDSRNSMINEIKNDMEGFFDWLNSFPSWVKSIWSRTKDAHTYSGRISGISLDDFIGIISKAVIIIACIFYPLVYVLLTLFKLIFSLFANLVAKIFSSKTLQYKKESKNENEINIDFSNSLFRKAKKDLNNKKITEKEYKDLIQRETEQMLMDEYIRKKGNLSDLNITVSGEKNKLATDAIRLAIKNFNNRVNIFVSNSKIPENKKNEVIISTVRFPNTIIVRDTKKNNIVDIYSNMYGELESMTEGLENVMMGSKQDLSLLAGTGIDLSGLSKPKTIIAEKFYFGAQKKQIADIMKQLKGNKGNTIIDLENVSDKNINTITSAILKEVAENENISKNIVFRKNGIYFGATSGKVSTYLAEWKSIQQKTNQNILEKSLKFQYKNIDLEASQLDLNIDEHYVTENIEELTEENYTNIGNVNDFGSGDERLYFDGNIRNEIRQWESLFSTEILPDKVKITVKKDKMKQLAEAKNLAKFVKGLRQFEIQYRDIKKGIEIVLPEIEANNEDSEKEARKKIKEAAEFFIYEMKKNFFADHRDFILVNERGNLLSIGNTKLHGTIDTKLINQKVLVIPEHVLTNEALFREWLRRMLLTEEMRNVPEIILGLDKAEILPLAIGNILQNSFANEAIKIVNRKGENLLFQDEIMAPNILYNKETNTFTIANSRMNANIELALQQHFGNNNISNIVISDLFAKSQEDMNRLMTLLKRYNYTGDIEIKSVTGASVKLWQENLFNEGALVRDISSVEELEEVMKFLEQKKEVFDKGETESEYASTHIIFNMNFGEKTKKVYKRINNMINTGFLGNVTIMQRGEIIASNGKQILDRENQYLHLRDTKVNKLNKIKSSIKTTSPNEALVFTEIKGKDDTEKRNNQKAEEEKITILKDGSNIPIFRGNVVAVIKGATTYIINNITAQDAVLNKQAITSADIIKLSTESAKAIKAYSLDFVLESRKLLKNDNNINRSSIRHLDSAA
ncbi:MAG: hypothetical protein LBF97_05650, partial [Elusimicrobiota bacterium]|nr:hypothetical protein [Elusimicrobiota bacterium]